MQPTRFRLLGHGIAWGLFLVLLAFGAPTVEAIYAEYAIPLPRITNVVFRASRLAIALGPLVIVLLGADWFVMDALSRRSDVSGSRAWSVLMLTFPSILLALALMALSIPLFTIDTGLSG